MILCKVKSWHIDTLCFLLSEMAKSYKKRSASRKKGKRSASRRMRRRFSKRGNSNKKFHKALCVLKSMKHSDRCKALSCANNSFIRKFGSTVRKLKNRKITPKQRKRLQPYRNQLRKIANPKVSAVHKRRILSQKGGGFLGALLPLAVSVVAPLVNKIFGKK